MLCVSEARESCEEGTKDHNARLTSRELEDMQRDVPECLGCFPLLPDDGLHESPHAYDDTCIHWNSTSPCRSGLPFYSMRSDSLDTSLCHSFCTAKGLDLSGIVRDKDSLQQAKHVQEVYV